jgi:hypothetical protein
LRENPVSAMSVVMSLPASTFSRWKKSRVSSAAARARTLRPVTGLLLA